MQALVLLTGRLVMRLQGQEQLLQVTPLLELNPYENALPALRMLLFSCEVFCNHEAAAISSLCQ